MEEKYNIFMVKFHCLFMIRKLFIVVKIYNNTRYHLKIILSDTVIMKHVYYNIGKWYNKFQVLATISNVVVVVSIVTSILNFRKSHLFES